LRSSAFAPGETIPKKFAGDGDNLSPPLEWSSPPVGTKSFALIVEDPDAPSGTFLHWGIYNIDADRRRLPEGFAASGEGVNGFGHSRYDGPQPPPGDAAHHYHFKLAALDTRRIDLKPKASVDELWSTVEPHILAQTELVGLYGR
jgi:Raf kinase inhibitor-like YbhB/YbcL family protein